MGTEGFSTARRKALLIIAAQAALTVVLALVCGLALGALAGRSALIGGGIGVLGNLVQALFSMRQLPPGGDPQLVLGALYRGVVLKVAVTVLAFVWVLRGMRVAPAELFCVYAATFVVYWLALACTSMSGSKLRAP
ncbi:MAG: ATP synthase subunit I [Steroidobacteraceae bacterium]|jgi:F0F1-type ATP synthase assembly protein I